MRKCIICGTFTTRVVCSQECRRHQTERIADRLQALTRCEHCGGIELMTWNSHQPVRFMHDKDCPMTTCQGTAPNNKPCALPEQHTGSHHHTPQGPGIINRTAARLLKAINDRAA